MAAKKILVADDELGFRDLFRFALEPCGYEVETVCNGEEALQQIMEQSFDLVVLDVNMPKMAGPETFQRIRMVRPNQRIVVMSASCDPEQEQELKAFDAGITCLYKPLEFDEILAALQQALTQEDCK